MITFSNLGSHGNLGNQLHQLASLIGFSEKYGCDLVLPPWQYAGYFQGSLKEGFIVTDMLIEEPHYHYTPEFWDAYKNDFETKNIDILGWLQSEKYWQHCREKVFNELRFESTFEENTLAQFREIFRKETIAISIRRGDFITNPNFYFLPMAFYFGALQQYFPNYEQYNVLFFSDDLNYCNRHIRHFPNFYFAKGLNGIEQLCLMSKCDHFIISNSSFSWWGAMLGEKNASRIIRSPYQLTGELSKRFDTKDYYPERWLAFDHEKQILNVDFFFSSLVGKEWKSFKQYANKMMRKARQI